MFTFSQWRKSSMENYMLHLNTLFQPVISCAGTLSLIKKIAIMQFTMPILQNCSICSNKASACCCNSGWSSCRADAGLVKPVTACMPAD